MFFYLVLPWVFFICGYMAARGETAGECRVCGNWAPGRMIQDGTCVWCDDSED